MDIMDKEYYRLLKTVYDIRKLRYNVSVMSYIARSVTLVPIPEPLYKDDDE